MGGVNVFLDMGLIDFIVCVLSDLVNDWAVSFNQRSSGLPDIIFLQGMRNMLGVKNRAFFTRYSST